MAEVPVKAQLPCKSQGVGKFQELFPSLGPLNVCVCTVGNEPSAVIIVSLSNGCHQNQKATRASGPGPVKLPRTAFGGNTPHVSVSVVRKVNLPKFHSLFRQGWTKFTELLEETDIYSKSILDGLARPGNMRTFMDSFTTASTSPCMETIHACFADFQNQKGGCVLRLFFRGAWFAGTAIWIKQTIF